MVWWRQPQKLNQKTEFKALWICTFLCILELLSSIPLGILQMYGTNNLHEEGFTKMHDVNLNRVLGSQGSYSFSLIHQCFLSPGHFSTLTSFFFAGHASNIIRKWKQLENFRVALSQHPPHAVVLWLLPQRSQGQLLHWCPGPAFLALRTVLQPFSSLSHKSHCFLFSGYFPSALKFAVISSFLKKKELKSNNNN